MILLVPSVNIILLFAVIRELQKDFKPETDSKVANRLIGSALGIKIQQNKASPEAPAIAPVTIPDSWDD